MRSLALTIFVATVAWAPSARAEASARWTELQAAFQPACSPDYTARVCRCGLAVAVRRVGYERVANELAVYGDLFLERSPLKAVALVALRNCAAYFRASPFLNEQPQPN